MLKKNEVLRDIRETLGSVPKFFEDIPESSIGQEWDTIKRFEFGETNIPNKYKELIGLGIASAIHCPYCTIFHKEAAITYGANEDEIEEAVHLAKHTVGWSSYLHGTEADLEQFKKDVNKVNDYVRGSMLKKKVA